MYNVLFSNYSSNNNFNNNYKINTMKLIDRLNDGINWLMGVRFEDEVVVLGDRCLHYSTNRCDNFNCDGYSSVILCENYIDQKHLDEFKRYHL